MRSINVSVASLAFGAKGRETNR